MQNQVVSRWGSCWILCWLLLHLNPSLPVHAQTIAKPITLGWDASADVAVCGYAIYFGRTNLTANTRLDAGTNLSCTISGLLVGVTYRIYAVSYDAQSIESPPSNQLTYTPAPPRVQLARQANGGMSLSYFVGTNTTCAIQFAATPTPIYWQTLANVTPDQAGNLILTDTTANRVPQRFYRVALSAQPLTSPVRTTLQPGGSIQLDWTTPPVALSRIQYATNPNATTWTTLATVASNDEGQATYLDATAAGAELRFYRAVIP